MMRRNTAKPKSTSSRLGRLAKFCLTVYLLAALCYTAYHFVVDPAVRAVLGSDAEVELELQRLSEAHAAAAAAAAAAGAGGAAGAAAGGVDGASSSALVSQIAAQVQGGIVTAVDADGKLIGTKTKNRHAALETAGVRASDIRKEDSHDKVWAAAEMAAKAGKKIKATYIRPKDLIDGRELVRTRVEGLESVEWDADQMVWHHPSHPLAHSGPSSDPSQWNHDTGPRDTLALSEDHFLSLSFSSSLQPSKVIPYYYRASDPDRPDFNKEDITITTLITSNRLEVFKRLVERYQGPISATVHLSDSSTHAETLQQLDEAYNGSSLMSKYVDIHLVYDSFDRQFNMWRNVAKYFARTEYVMMLDVDFWLCTDFRSRILGSEEIMARLRGGLAAFVVPAFEFAKQSDGIDPFTFPTTKEETASMHLQELVNLVQNEKIGMFHKSWAPGHGSTNYTKYYIAKPGEVYRVTGYTHSYEPYAIFKKEGTPWCDERFIGYGGNKAACLYELYLSGVSFYVLPDDFLIHQSHAYAEKARQHERRYNRKLYIDFREETCFRYLNMFIDQIDSPRAKNLAQECKKLKGFPSTAARYITAASGNS
ncbi:BQ2448_661 [Microbotryum intermedium]|uniref:BQ2448_661 protein n=1 Tax=Microbotryum intermedium TaxID=269621 RepID=A0A238F323_9BASI|nr:BQ2448_661 [Microbotryum intermedium]